MSGLDPLAAFALQAVANAQAALEDATLHLGSLFQDLRAQLAVGDILTASVLPPESGSDRLSILGQTVAAQLPPGILPGETIALQVSGFTARAVIVRNLGLVDPGTTESDAQTPSGVSTPATAPPTQAAARAPTESAPPGNPSPGARADGPGGTPIRATPLPDGGSRLAPPRELFVAASVRPTPGREAASPGPAPSASPGELEVRIAATRAASGLPHSSPAEPAQRPPLPSVRAGTPPAMPARAAAPAAETTFMHSSRATPAPPNRILAPPTTPRLTPDAALLTRLRVPISVTTLAAARIGEAATRAVTAAFEHLDVLLAGQPNDETLLPLRSMLAFVARLDLRNPAVLPQQIAAYVSNVVTGAEAKIAQIVRVLGSLPDALPESSAAASPHETSPQSAVPPLQSFAQPAASPELPPNIAAQAAERDVALAHDLKSALLQFVTNPPAAASSQVVAAAREALAATTAVQLNALQAQNADPRAITIALPAYFHPEGTPTRLRIWKDAGDRKQTLDADNFHIAFVLDTASLGTVAIDVQTAGRSVNVDVKTQDSRAAERFRSSLGDLRGRLEQLHYRVASMAAGLATRAPSPEPPPAVAPATDARVDERA